MTKAQEIMQVLANYGDGDQIRYLNQLLQRNGEKSVTLRTYNHAEADLGKAIGFNGTVDMWNKFTEFMQKFEMQLPSHSKMTEAFENDEDVRRILLMYMTIIIRDNSAVELATMLGYRKGQ